MKRSTRKWLRKLLGALMVFGPLFVLMLWSCKWSWLKALEGFGMGLGATATLGAFIFLMFWGMDLMGGDR